MRLGHFQTAIDLLDDLLALDPSHRDGAQLRTAASQQLHLADTYQSAIDAEAARKWTDAANAYAEILNVDATYRDAAARREACQARQRVLDLQGELRHHAAAGQWQAVLDVNAELGHLDPAATDPDGFATQAQHVLDDERRADELAHRYTRARDAEDARHWAAAASEHAEILRARSAVSRRHCTTRQLPAAATHQRSQIPARASGRGRGMGQGARDLRPTHRARPSPGRELHRVRGSRAARAYAPRVPKRRWVLIAAAAGAVAVAAGVTAILVLALGHDTGTIEVPAAQAWTDTHVDCQTGKLLEVSATGTALANKSKSSSAVGPSGDSNPDLLQFNVPGLPNVNHAALIGSVDRKQPFFVVGKNATLHCLSAGRLFLGINDIDVTNNSGKFTATIKQR